MIIEPLPDSAAYWTAIRARARQLGSDGCTFPATQIYQEACYEHDQHYRTHAWIGDEPITRAEADAVMRMRIQQKSPFGRASPMAWWRWMAIQARHSWPVAKALELLGKPTPWDDRGR